MWKLIQTVVGLLVTLAGALSLRHWRALDVIGRLLTMADLGTTYDRLLDWIAAHPHLAVDWGPWILIAVGVGSIFLTHISSLQRIYCGLRGNAKGHDPAPLVKHSTVLGRKPLTLREIFDSDFEGLARIFTMQSISIPGLLVYCFPVTEYLDIYTNSYFISVYVSRSQDIVTISDIIVHGLENIVANLGQIEFEVTISGDTKKFSNSTMRFSGQIYLYIEQYLSLSEMANIEKLYEAAGMHVHILSSAYLVLHQNEFDRVPHSAEDAGGMGAQLPKMKTGDFVRVRNRAGSLPSTSTIPPSVPPPLQHRQKKANRKRPVR
jgi:hypothetical protein